MKQIMKQNLTRSRKSGRPSNSKLSNTRGVPRIVGALSSKTLTILN